MTEHWSLEEHRIYLATGKEPVRKPGPPPTKDDGKSPAESTPKAAGSKMRNVPVVVDGIRFDSKGEAAYYLYLQGQVEYGALEYFLRQVPVECGGGVKMVLDFMLVLPGGGIEFVDYKGRLSQTYRNKKKQALARYPTMQIREVFRKDVPRNCLDAVNEIHEIALATAANPN